MQVDLVKIDPDVRDCPAGCVYFIRCFFFFLVFEACSKKVCSIETERGAGDETSVFYFYLLVSNVDKFIAYVFASSSIDLLRILSISLSVHNTLFSVLDSKFA